MHSVRSDSWPTESAARKTCDKYDMCKCLPPSEKNVITKRRPLVQVKVNSYENR